MSRLWINNLPPDVTEDEIGAFLEKYGFPPFDDLIEVPGDGSRPAVVVSFGDLDEEVLRRLQTRVNGVFVRERAISVQVAPPARPEPR